MGSDAVQFPGPGWPRGTTWLCLVCLCLSSVSGFSYVVSVTTTLSLRATGFDVNTVLPLSFFGHLSSLCLLDSRIGLCSWHFKPLFGEMYATDLNWRILSNSFVLNYMIVFSVLISTHSKCQLFKDDMGKTIVSSNLEGNIILFYLSCNVGKQ